MSDKKIPDIARIIIGKNANEAVQLLKFIPRKSARFIEKTLWNAIANEVRQGIRSEILMIKEAWRSRALRFSVSLWHRAGQPIRSKKAQVIEQ
jgi:ribosomal protein L22